MTCTVLDASGLAADLNRLGVPYAVARQFGYEPYPGGLDKAQDIALYAAQQYDKLRAWRETAGNPNVYFMVNNEQGHDWRRIMMYRHMIYAALNDPQGPVGMVFLNAAIGTIKCGFHDEPNEWASGELYKLLLLLDDVRETRLPGGTYAFILGDRRYTSMYWWIAANAGKYAGRLGWDVPDRFAAGDYHIDWSLAQDHIGRNYQGIRRALGWQWDDEQRKWVFDEVQGARRADGKPVLPPWMIATEQFIDRMNDVNRWHPGIPVDMGEPTPRGYNSLRTWWGQVFGHPAGLVLARFTDQSWRYIDGPEGFLIGGHTFCLGDTGGHQTHTVSPGGNPDRDYFDAITPVRYPYPEHWFGLPAPAPAPEPAPVPLPAPLPEPSPVPVPAPVGLPENYWLGGLLLAIGILIGLFIRDRILSAQAAPPEVSMSPILGLEQLLILIATPAMNYVAGLFVGWLGSQPLTQVLKTVLGRLNFTIPYIGLNPSRIPANTIAWGAAFGVAAALMVAQLSGTRPALDNLGNILLVIAGPLSLLLGSYTGSMVSYRVYRATSVPVLGYSRSRPPKLASLSKAA